MSALPPKADIGTQSRNVRFVPKADKVRRSKMALFDHLVGADEQRRRHGDPERFSRLKIDNYVEFGRPLNWKFARLRTLQNLVNESGCPIVHISKVATPGSALSVKTKEEQL